ncbi:MAG TPA: DUF58 domain-containing protein [Thermoleophilaceae bacterium]|nr:DUF58 domain-containing protein [Thermoleophilaceae bacterium]
MSRAIATALLGAGLCLVGGMFDTASLYLPGVAIVLAVALSTVWVWVATIGARVVRLPTPATVVEDAPFRIQVEARLGWLPALGGELTDPLLTAGSAIAGRRRVRLDALATLPRRGRVALEPSRLAVSDPLQICTRQTRGANVSELLVLPRIDPVTVVAPGGTAAAGGLAGLGAGAHSTGRWREDAHDGVDLDGLRPYREGAPASRIHWATLARRGEMMERRFVAESASAPLIVLDVAAPASVDALDAAVRAAASLCVALARVEGVALLVPGHRRPISIDHDLGAWPGVHKLLALVEAGTKTSVGGLGPRSGGLLWVTAAAGGAIPRELELLPARPRYLVAPTLPLGTTAAFEVGGCSGRLIDRGSRSAVA